MNRQDAKPAKGFQCPKGNPTALLFWVSLRPLRLRG